MGVKGEWVHGKLLGKRAIGLALAALISFSVLPGFPVWAEDTGAASGIVYKVEPGDSLEKIAKEFNVTVAEITAANQMNPNDILNVGQELIIHVNAKVRLRSDDVTNRSSDGIDKTVTTAENATSTNTTLASGTVSINMSNMDIRDILSAIALSMDVNILYIGDPLTVSFKVDNVSAAKALELLVQSTSASAGTMGYLQDGDIIIVGSQDKLQKDFFNKMALTRYRVNYISPEVLSAQLDKLGIPVQKITLDKSSKYIWAQGLPQSLTKVAEVIASLDRAENFDTDTSQLKASFSLTPYQLEYISADNLGNLITKLSLGVKTITVDTNPKVLWANGTAQELKDLEQLIMKVDVAESAGEDFEMEACRLTFLTYSKLIPIISQLDLPVQIIKVGTSQKALWLKGTPKDILDLKDLITKLDIKENNEIYQYFLYPLKYISPADAAAKLEFIGVEDVQTLTLNYPDLSHEILIRCGSDMKSTVLDILLTLDVPGKKIKMPVDAGNSQYNLTVRKNLLNKLLGIPLENMFVSDNVSKSGEGYYVLWADETPDNIKLMRSMITQIDSPQ